MPPIPPEKYTPEQKATVDEFVAGRKRPVFGPFIPLLRSPELMNLLKQMGDYLNFKAPAGGRKLTEFIILITAREWGSDYEWYAHYHSALKGELEPAVIEDIAQGRRPDGMSEDEDAVYNFVTELMRNKRVSDKSYDRIVKRFGEKGAVDIAGVVGFYTTLAMVMNTSRLELPKDGTRLPRFPD